MMRLPIDGYQIILAYEPGTTFPYKVFNERGLVTTCYTRVAATRKAKKAAKAFKMQEISHGDELFEGVAGDTGEGFACNGLDSEQIMRHTVISVSVNSVPDFTVRSASVRFRIAVS